MCPIHKKQNCSNHWTPWLVDHLLGYLINDMYKNIFSEFGCWSIVNTFTFWSNVNYKSHKLYYSQILLFLLLLLLFGFWTLRTTQLALVSKSSYRFVSLYFHLFYCVTYMGSHEVVQQLYLCLYSQHSQDFSYGLSSSFV